MATRAKHYESGLHGDFEVGPIDVGLAVSTEAMGVAIDAPLLGQLRAAFTVLSDGTTRLTALSRHTAQGVETPVLGLTDEAQLLELSTDLAARQTEVADLAEKVAGLEA